MSALPSPAQIQALRSTFLFSGLDDARFAELSAHATIIPLANGQILFSQGEPLRAFYWVLDGRMRLFRSSPNGDEKVIELIGPGQFFAEAVMFMGGGYPVHAAAQGATRVMAFDARSFKDGLAQDSASCFRMMAAMSMRLHELVNEIDHLTLMKGEERLLQYLLDHAVADASGQSVVAWEAPKQVIASRIGVKPETLSRLLGKLANQGLIEEHRQQLFIRDAAKLRQAGFD